jgi:2-iminobutanoate/2-iminopropanoate deaminase
MQVDGKTPRPPRMPPCHPALEVSSLHPFVMTTSITTLGAPPALGPYSQAIAAGPFLFSAGQIPLDPEGNSLVESDISTQTRRVLENLSSVLQAAGMDFGHVVKTTIFMTDLENFAAMNTVYAGFFREPYPARSTVQVAALPRGAHIEIEVTAYKP